MEWLEAFDAARQRGSHAFLCTGNVGDAFPSTPPREDAPVDALWGWAETVERWVRREGENHARPMLLWTFDPVSGFTFRTREDEQEFRRLARMTPAAPANDPVAQAQAGVAQAMPLPNDSLEAVRAMRIALTTASVDPTSRQCIVILPHADILCPVGAVAGGAAPTALVALALIQIASSDALRRAGHLVLLAAPTAASVDEQLRRTDGPIYVMAVDKPTAAERTAFVERCCSQEASALQQQCDAAHAERVALECAERERIGKRMDAVRAERTAYVATREQVLTGDAAYRCAVQRRDAAKQAYDRAIAKAVADAGARREELLREQALLDIRLNAADIPRRNLADSDAGGHTSNSPSRSKGEMRSDPAIACERLDADVWKSIRNSDAVRLLFHDGHTEDLLVLHHHRNGQCTLAFAANPTDPIAWGRGSSGAAAFNWKDGAIVITAVNESEPQLLPLPDGCTGMYRVPVARRVLEARRADIVVAIADDPSDPSRRCTAGELAAFRKIHEPFAEAEHAVTGAEAVALEQWIVRQRALDEEIGILESAYNNPSTPAIAALDARIASLVKARAMAQQRGLLPLPQMGREHFVRATQGLGYRDIAALLRDPEADAGTVAQRRLVLLQRAYGHLLDVIEPLYGFEGLAGLTHVKRVLTQARDAMLRGDRKAVPQGIFLMGPPGTGKTAIAHAFARECGMLLVRMRNLRNMFVGNSEQRVEEVCQALLDLAPCVCFRDETDQEDSGRDAYQGDSGVSSRVRQRLMEFEADERIRGRVLFVKATNRPDLVDAAMKRDGRADERIVVITGAAEYAGLFPVYVAREGFPCSVTDFAPFASLVRERGFSGAGVLNVCRRAYQFGSGTITEQTLRDAIADAVPSADRVADARMTLAAVAAANSQRSLPDDIERIVADALAVIRGAAPAAPADAARAFVEAVESAALVEATKGQKH